MDGFNENIDALKEAKATVVAASVDDIDNAKKIAEGKNFPIGHGVTRDIADALGSWWEDRRQIIQPSEFIIDADTGKIVVSSYSDGPLARLDSKDVLKWVKFWENQKNK